MGTSQFFEGHDITKLRRWLLRYLDKHSDSDPKTFTDYIVELIPTTVTPSNRIDTAKLVDELRDLLESETENFVDTLSNVLRSKSYMHESSSSGSSKDNGDTSNGGRHNYQQSSYRSDSGEIHRDEYHHHHHHPHTRRRQRESHDHDDRTSHPRSHYEDGYTEPHNDRDQKRRRRESPSRQYRESRQYVSEHRDYYDDRSGSRRRHVDGYEPVPPHVSPYSMTPYQNEGNSYFHPSQRGVAQDAVTLVSAGGRVHSIDEDHRHSRERFDHGGRRGRHPHGEYTRGGRGGRRGGRGGRRDTGPAPPEAYLPKRTQEEWAKLEEEMKDNKCTIVVSSIPPEHSNHDELRNYFTQFGQISEMSVKKHLNRAYIQFENFDDAMKAVKSPEAIFGNRFIRVNFAKKQDFNVGGSAKKKRRIEGEDSAADSTGNQEIAPGTTQGSNAYISPQTLEKIQKEQKLHRIQQEQLQLQQDIQQLQQQKQLEKEKLLLQSTLDLRRTLTAKLDEAGESESNKQKIIEKLKDLDETIAGTLERIKKNETVTALAAAPTHVTHRSSQIVAASTQSDLKESIDTPSETTEKISESEEVVDTMESSSHFRGRGRGYRGGSWRGRGAGAPGRGRGNFRGGYSAGGGLSLRLSNITSFVATNIPESKRSVEAIKDHFSAFGELVSVDMSEGEDKAVIQFDTRQSAEQAIKQGKQLEGNTLRFTWHQPQAPTDETPSKKHVSTTHTGTIEEVSPGGKSSTRDRFRREKDDDDDDDIYTYDDDDEDRERSWRR